MGSLRALTNHLRSIRFVEEFVRDVEDECMIRGIDASKKDILTSVIRDIEEIAHQELGDGPGFLADTAEERRRFRQGNAPPAKRTGGSHQR